MQKLKLAALLFVAAACSSDPTGLTSESLASFDLPDVNPTSSSYQLDVSPRNYLGEVSAWYFGIAT